MEVTDEIKARLPIEDLVGQYCQLQKKGRTMVCMCPFHNDKNPSMNVSPDKGIAYCFACQSGGDIFTFYQLIEGVDFRQALKDLAEKTGVKLPDAPKGAPKVNKDEKDRLRACLKEACVFYINNINESEAAKKCLQDRALPVESVKKFSIGAAPNSFSATYEHLLKKGFSKSEILAAGLGVQKDLQEGKIYDRFRNRLMFPIHDTTGKIVGFGGRTLGDDDAKYINSSDGPLYHKSNILYGLHHAKESIRSTKKVIMVEGYFDVIACHRVGVQNVVAVSGTALTEQHVKILKRYCDTVVLCLDQDRAGQDAAERAFLLCSKQGLHVQVINLGQKDPDEEVRADPEGLKQKLSSEGKAYLEHVLDLLQEQGVSSVEQKRSALQRLLPLLDSVSTEVEKAHYLARSAAVLSTTETALIDDLAKAKKEPLPQKKPVQKDVSTKEGFSKMEITLGLFLLYPLHLELIQQLIEPKEGFCGALYEALKSQKPVEKLTVEMLDLPQEYAERASILYMFCEHHNLSTWTESLALQELKKNCLNANREMLKKKQREIVQQLAEARKAGRKAEEEQLNTQYHHVLKLAQMSMG